MKPEELKIEYIRLRVEGKSQSAIAEALHISKTTCGKWDKDLADQIDEGKRAKLAELCEGYGMAKEARIKTLGEMLGKIDEALAAADLSKVDPIKLLDYKLKYMEALKAEYAATQPPIKLEAITAHSIAGALSDLLNQVRAGEIGTEQAQKEALLLTTILKAQKQAELKAQFDELEAIVGGRR